MPQTGGVGAARDVPSLRRDDRAICLTDLPLHVSRLPLVAHYSLRRRAGLISAPALGLAFALTTNTIWQIGDALDGPRLTLIMLLSLVGLVGWLIIAHDLWEKVSGDTPPELARLFNLSTGLTLGLAAGASYLVLFAGSSPRWPGSCRRAAGRAAPDPNVRRRRARRGPRRLGATRLVRPPHAAR
jgi:hypothetical protein